MITALVTLAATSIRSAVLEQNLPGVSVAVGAGGTVVWAEGFGWRDVETRAPVTPDTRFNIGTAASAVTAAVAPVGLTDTAADSAAEWSPEHIGEPEEDCPLFTIIRDVVFRPIGLATAEPLQMRYEVTIEDPSTFDRPYTAVLDLEPQQSIYEYACHEGNRGLENILRAARSEERAAETARGGR